MLADLETSLTKSGSNCRPAYFSSSSMAHPSVKAFLYGRSVVMASNVSAIMMTRAPTGICSPDSPSG